MSAGLSRTFRVTRRRRTELSTLLLADQPDKITDHRQTIQLARTRRWW